MKSNPGKYHLIPSSKTLQIASIGETTITHNLNTVETLLGISLRLSWTLQITTYLAYTTKSEMKISKYSDNVFHKNISNP